MKQEVKNSEDLRPVWPLEIIENSELIQFLGREKFITVTDLEINLGISIFNSSSVGR